ncbi:hypothetical protein FACS189443_6710 [Planctomycetales bacterium]|nr:hypothetical protein FACS189443_6710 [Planctomycetales bacterium]
MLILLLGLLIFSPVGCSNSAPRPVSQTVQSPPAAQQIEFIENRAEGLETAGKERKPILMFFTIPNSKGSQRMLETTFCDMDVLQLSQRFVCIKIDAPQESQFCATLGISGFPTIVLANPNGGEIQRLTGKLTADQLAVQMHAVLQTVAMRSGTVR